MNGVRARVLDSFVGTKQCSVTKEIVVRRGKQQGGRSDQVSRGMNSPSSSRVAPHAPVFDVHICTTAAAGRASRPCGS